MHLTVPAAGDSTVTKILRKLKWTLVTVLAPELVLALGAMNRLEADYLMTCLRELEGDGRLEGTVDEIDIQHMSSRPAQYWTIEPKPPNFLSLIYSRFKRSRRTKDVLLEAEAPNIEQQQLPVVKADSVIELDRISRTSMNSGQTTHSQAPPYQCIASRRQVFTLTHAYLVVLGGLRLELQRDGELPKDHSRSHWEACIPYLTTSSLVDVVYRFPFSPLQYIDITEEEIRDKSNSDIFTKLIAIGQILSLALSVLSRWVRHIAVSQLELVTLAFAVMATLIYLVNLDKPQNIEVASVLKMSKFSTDPEMDRHIRLNMVHTFDFRYGNPANDEELVEVAKMSRLDNLHYNSRLSDSHYKTSSYLMIVSSVVFGALHCIAWKYDFPTSAERLLWRIAAVASTVLPCFIFLLRSIVTAINVYFVFMITLLYTMARLILITITFTSLRQMPADLYISTWAQYIPTIN